MMFVGVAIVAMKIVKSELSNFMKYTYCLLISGCLFLETNVPTATNIAYETTLSPIATDTHFTNEMIPALPYSIPTSGNVAYAVPLQPDSSSLQPATANSCAEYNTVVPQDNSPAYDFVP